VTDDELRQRWEDWARRNQLGDEVQIQASADAAVRAASQGASSVDAAKAARESARLATGSVRAEGVSGERGPDTSAEPAPSAAGITWELAMENAGLILADIPVKQPFRGAQYNFQSSRAAVAQAWIAFARELTMHGRAVHY
jgi:hypothetical protein